MKKYRFEVIQKNEIVTIHQSFNVDTENTRRALMYGLQHMIQDKTATSITTKCLPLSDVVDPFIESRFAGKLDTLQKELFPLISVDSQCPYNHVFSQDCDTFRECDYCEKWNHCSGEYVYTGPSL